MQAKIQVELDAWWHLKDILIIAKMIDDTVDDDQYLEKADVCKSIGAILGIMLETFKFDDDDLAILKKALLVLAKNE